MTVNQWKKANRRKTMFAGRLMLAYNVPGTREAGELAMLMANRAITERTYSVVVRDPNSWDAATGTHNILRDCGHQHRSQLAAEACMERLLAYQCDHGRAAGMMCSECRGRAKKHLHQAAWHNAAVEAL